MNPFDLRFRDFDRYLSGSVFRLGNTVYKHSRVGYDEDEDVWYLKGHVLDDSDRWIREDRTYRASARGDDNNVRLDFPAMGYINYKGGFVYASRIPARQWNLGYNSSSVALSDIQQYERAEYGITIPTPRDLVMHGAFVRRLFNRYFFTYEHALSQLREGRRVGAAINSSIAIGQSMLVPHLVIYYKDIVVGWVDDNDQAHLFKCADYVSAVCPFPVTVEEEYAA